MRLFLLFSLVAHVLAKYQLSGISITSGIETLPVENGANLYVQSNDDEALLGAIKITNNLSTKTALELSKLGTNLDGTKIGWAVTGEVTISSTNTQMNAAKLSGFVYYTTLTQAQDKNFLVYAVDSNKVISYNNDDLTVVFLNQKIVWDDNTGINLKRRVIRPTYVPTKSSQVYDYTTFPNSDMKIYWDEPTETYKNQYSDDSKNNRIFSNPYPLTIPQYFNSVEPFQIFNDIWYLRSSGQIRFQVRPKWDDPNGTTTSSVTTTGLVMCSFVPENITINMLANYANAAVTGMNVLYDVINPVSFQLSGGAIGILKQGLNRQSELQKSGSTMFMITSQSNEAGRYAVQYFQIEGAALPTTTQGPTTTAVTTLSQSTSTTTVVTTTKPAASTFNLLVIIVAVFNVISITLPI